MEVTEFEPEHVMRVRTQDGPMTINGWMVCDAAGDNETLLRIGGEFFDVDESMAAEIRQMMERSVATIKALIETET